MTTLLKIDKVLCFHLSIFLFMFCIESCNVFEGKSNPAESTSIKVAIPNPVIELNPLTVITAQESFILPLIFEDLFSEKSNGDIFPDLAESWDYDKKRNRLVIRIRKDHYFSDGDEVQADHILKSVISHCLSDERNRAWTSNLKGCNRIDIDNIGVQTIDRYTIIFEINSHPSSFLYQLVTSPSIVFKRLESGHLIGSGPYQVYGDDSESLTLVLNPHYNRKQNSLFEKINFVFVPEKEIIHTLSSGNFDIASMYLTNTFSEDFELKGFSIIKHAPYITQTLVLNPHIFPFNSKVVREAVSEKLKESDILSCRANQVGAYGLIPKGIGGSISRIRAKKVTSNSEQIEDLLPKLRDVKVTIYRHIGRKNDCEEKKIIGAFSSLNIQADFLHLDSYKELIPIYLNRKTQAYVELFVFGFRDPVSKLVFFEPKSKTPFFFYTDHEIEKRIERTFFATNLEERFKIYREINQMILDQGSVMPLYYVGHSNIIKNCLVSNARDRLNYNPNSFLFLLDLKHDNGCKT